ncbi:MAG: response regulator transcription factor [Planctomycetes bacterium]|nr:response regulator transcription factor [Planctomycetota bacterium]
MIDEHNGEERAGPLTTKQRVNEVFASHTLRIVRELHTVLEGDSGPLTLKERKRVTSITHQIKGSAGCYGFPELGRVAAQMHALVERNAGRAQLSARCSELSKLSTGIRPSLEERGTLSLTGEGPFRIALVEDDPSISVLLEMCLQDSGFRVDSFADGAVALAELQSGLDPDLIILDLMLPGASGREIIGAVRQADGLSGPPIVVLSASAVPQGPNGGHIEGAQAFLQKPFRMNDLQKIITELLCKE